MIYQENGYIDIEKIADENAWLYVIIGARQVGKTYGTLKYHLDKKIPHILLRRTREELEMIGANEMLNPYKVFYPNYDISLKKKNKTFQIIDNSTDEVLGLALALSQIAHIRGFNGSSYQSIIFDEFIPEKGVIRRGSEGDALLNAYTTINGNRELAGSDPCKLWLLANSNDINSPILEALNLTDPVIEMRRRHRDFFSDKGICIVQPESRTITEQRSNTALMRQIRRDSEFYEMSIKNEFAYDVNPLIKLMPIKGMTPVCSFDDTLYIWESPYLLYVCRAKHGKEPYSNQRYSRELFRANNLWMIRAYAQGIINFSDVRLLALFKQLMGIDF